MVIFTAPILLSLNTNEMKAYGLYDSPSFHDVPFEITSSYGMDIMDINYGNILFLRK